MNETTAKLLSICKIATTISLIFLFFIILSTYAFDGVGFGFALIISTLGALTALVAIISLLVKGIDRTGLLIALFFLNAICLVIYGIMIFYTFFIVPVGVNEMMN